MNRTRTISFLCALLVATTLPTAGRDDPVSFSLDLQPFGYIVEKPGRMVTDSTDLAFLSDDLLLVVLNQREWKKAVEPSLTDAPPAKLLLFDLNTRKVLKTSLLNVEKTWNSVLAVNDKRFVLLNEAGLQLCSSDLRCGSPLRTSGPVFVSPRGTRIAVGGNAQTSQTLLDAKTLQQIDRFAWNKPSVIPGDSTLIVRYGEKLFVRAPGYQDRPLSFGGLGVWPDARFLNDETLSAFDYGSRSAVVGRLDGSILYRIPVKEPWNAEILSSASGSRFCIHEFGYTRWNSIVNFLDIDNGRPANLQTMRVFDVPSGKEVLHMEWDPRPYVVNPALSPSGHWLAAVQSGTLKIINVP